MSDRLRLRQGSFETARLGGCFGVLCDALPDHWGRRVIARHGGLGEPSDFDLLLPRCEQRCEQKCEQFAGRATLVRLHPSGYGALRRGEGHACGLCMLESGASANGRPA